MKRCLICHDIISRKPKHPKQICPLFCLMSPLSSLTNISSLINFFYQADQFFQPHQLFIPSLHCPALSIFPPWSFFYTYSKNTIQPDQWCSKGHAQPLDEHQQVRTLIWLWSGSGRRNEIELGKMMVWLKKWTWKNPNPGSSSNGSRRARRCTARWGHSFTSLTKRFEILY